MTAGRPRADRQTPTVSMSAAEERAELEARADEAHQALLGMVFAAMRLRGRELRSREGSVPLTVIGGFLGSGKTTLLNRLLVAPHGRRLVVLVNDFGRVNIDAALVASRTDDMISLANGCACCVVSADLTNALIEIGEREDPPDAIVLEASGIADPNAIVQIALANPATRLDGSLVVVDAETVEALAEDPRTSRLFHSQISAADLIVLSKVDLIDHAQRDEAKRWIEAHYPDALVVEAVNGDLPTEVVLGIDSERDLRAAPPEPTDHTHEFESVSFEIDGVLDAERLDEVFDLLPRSVLRAKGQVWSDDRPERRTIYQRVGARWGRTPGEPWGSEAPRSSLVFIGPTGSLDRAALEAQLEGCRRDERAR